MVLDCAESSFYTTLSEWKDVGGESCDSQGIHSSTDDVRVCPLCTRLIGLRLGWSKYRLYGCWANVFFTPSICF